MDSPVVFFLLSKRFWAGALSIPIGWLLMKVPMLADVAVSVCTQMAGLAEGQSCSPEVSKAFAITGIATLITWLVGMKYGKRAVSLTPKKDA